MKLDIAQIRGILNRLNMELFDGQLVLNFPIKFTKSKKMAACTAFSRSLKVAYIGISTQFEWNEKELFDSLAHELVHVYECQVAMTMPSHLGAFAEQMERINRDFNHVEIAVKTNMPLKRRSMVG